MNKLNVFICENFHLEYERIIETENFDDVTIITYPSMCERKSNKAKTQELLQNCFNDGNEGLILCNNNCDVMRLIPNGSRFNIHSSNSCFSHLANETLISYILEKGGYIIGLGWLRNWRENIENAGFDRDTAIRFYKEFCKELVFFDTGIDSEAEDHLIELSKFLELPYVIIHTELESIKLMIFNAVYEWRLHNSTDHGKRMAEIQTQCAEYSAIIDLMSKIASYTNHRDAIGKIKEIFLVVFGAQQFKFWSNDIKQDGLPEAVKELLCNDKKLHLLSKKEDGFCIKIQRNEKLYGVLEIGEFLFPEYIEKYLNFALEIVNICGLVFANIEQYEKVMQSEEDLRYLSYHDALTGLYNRTYINEIMETLVMGSQSVVFMFDIDRLKHVNDNFGHSSGDKLLINFSQVLKKCFRETDIIARIGGDEFVAILPEDGAVTAELIKNRIDNEIRIYNNYIKEDSLKIRVSAGFAVAENEEETIECLIQKADKLMYTEKLEKKMASLNMEKNNVINDVNRIIPPKHTET